MKRVFTVWQQTRKGFDIPISFFKYISWNFAFTWSNINTTNFIPNTPEKENKTTLEETSETVSSENLLLNSVTRRKKRSKKDDVPSRKDFLNFENDPSTTPTKSRETEESGVVSIATEKPAEDLTGRRPRRTRGAAVNYAEPSLNKKMRNENAFKTSKKKATKEKKTKENLKSKPQILKPKNVENVSI